GPRHRGIHHDDMRLEPAGERDRFLAVLRLADDGDRRIVLEQATEAAADHRVIVSEQDIDGTHTAAALRAGTVKRTSVPPAGGIRKSIVPPTRSARSRIVTSPSPRRPSAVRP